MSDLLARVPTSFLAIASGVAHLCIGIYVLHGLRQQEMQHSKFSELVQTWGEEVRKWKEERHQELRRLQCMEQDLLQQRRLEYWKSRCESQERKHRAERWRRKVMCWHLPWYHVRDTFTFCACGRPSPQRCDQPLCGKCFRDQWSPQERLAYAKLRSHKF